MNTEQRIKAAEEKVKAAQEELRQKVKAAQEELRQALEELKEKELLVPEEIDFRRVGEDIELIFNNGKSALSYSGVHGGVPHLTYAGLGRNKDYRKGETKFKLVKVDKPEKGKWYYATDDNQLFLGDVTQYILYTSENEYWFIEFDSEVCRFNGAWKHYYEVVPI